ncbi:hypothetical protein [Solihabitans fulvus]|nr:hypothetical protein [Solihabitans fulvus]
MEVPATSDRRVPLPDELAADIATIGAQHRYRHVRRQIGKLNA